MARSLCSLEIQSAFFIIVPSMLNRLLKGTEFMGMCDAAFTPGEIRLLLLQCLWWGDFSKAHALISKSVF